MGNFTDKPVHPKDRATGEEPSETLPHRDTVHPQTTDPTNLPGGAVTVDSEGIIRIGAGN